MFLTGYFHPDTKASIKWYTQALEKNSRLGYVYLSRGYAFLDYGDRKKAKSDFDQAINLMPQNEAALFALGDFYWKDGDPNRSRLLFSKVIKNTRDSWVTYVKRSETRFKIAEDKEALVDYILSRQILKDVAGIDVAVCEFVRLHPRGAYYAFEAAGNAKRDLKMYKLAIDDYSSSITFNQNNADVYSKRGKLYRKLKKREQAIADFEKSTALDSNNQEAVFELCRLYHETGNTKKMKEWFDILKNSDSEGKWLKQVSFIKGRN